MNAPAERATPTWVNLGCGLHAPEGWCNIDRSPSLLLDRARPVKQVLRRARLLTDEHMVSWPRSIVLRDVRRPLPFADRSVDAVYSSHMLEHLYLSEARSVLRECARVLRPDATLRLALPDGEQLARDLVGSGGSATYERALRYNDGLNAFPTEPPTRGGKVRDLFAGPPHRWQPTVGLVEQMLVDAGFGEVRRCTFHVGRLPDLERIEHRASSIFFEATVGG